MKSSFDEYKTKGGGRLVYLHFGQETPRETEERQALFQRVADSLGGAQPHPHHVTASGRGGGVEGDSGGGKRQCAPVTRQRGGSAQTGTTSIILRLMRWMRLTVTKC
jgi:hypothetical protein